MVELFVYHTNFGWIWWIGSHENCRNHCTIQAAMENCVLCFCFFKWKVTFYREIKSHFNIIVFMFNRQMMDIFYHLTVCLPSFYIWTISGYLSYTPKFPFLCITWELYYRKMLSHYYLRATWHLKIFLLIPLCPQTFVVKGQGWVFGNLLCDTKCCCPLMVLCQCCNLSHLSSYDANIMSRCCTQSWNYVFSFDLAMAQIPDSFIPKHSDRLQYTHV